MTIDISDSIEPSLAQEQFNLFQKQINFFDLRNRVAKNLIVFLCSFLLYGLLLTCLAMSIVTFVLNNDIDGDTLDKYDVIFILALINTFGNFAFVAMFFETYSYVQPHISNYTSRIRSSLYVELKSRWTLMFVAGEFIFIVAAYVLIYLHHETAPLYIFILAECCSIYAHFNEFTLRLDDPVNSQSCCDRSPRLLIIILLFIVDFATLLGIACAIIEM